LRSVSGTGTVFDSHLVLNSPKRYDILNFFIKNVIKQPGPVGTGLLPVATGAVAADRPQETL
jgi:hypothetical protein